MKKSKFTEAQVAAALRECATGTPANSEGKGRGMALIEAEFA